jgi:hypothetical protein
MTATVETLYDSHVTPFFVTKPQKAPRGDSRTRGVIKPSSPLATLPHVAK